MTATKTLETYNSLAQEVLKQTNKITTTSTGKYIEKYGLAFSPFTPDVVIELEAVKLERKIEDGGLGYAVHLKQAGDLLFPDLVDTYSHWTESRLQVFCEGHKYISWAGCGGAGKSLDAGVRLAIPWWLADPTKRAVCIASTTLSAMEKRVWGYITERMKPLSDMGFPGHLCGEQPPKILLAKKAIQGDRRHGFHAFAIGGGNADKTEENMKGLHPERKLLAIMDEYNSFAPGLMKSVSANWSKSVETYQAILIANSDDQLDAHGIASEPIDGWESVTCGIDKFWHTKYGGVCQHFDCYDSPAVVHPEESKKWFFYVNKKDIANDIAEFTVESKEYWKYLRGWWSEGGSKKLVIDRKILDKYGARDNVVFSGDFKLTIAALDPAKASGNGDECILMIGSIGMTLDGTLVLLLEETISIKTEKNNIDPEELQIVNQVIGLCEARGIMPFNLGVDTHGYGAGFESLFKTQWGAIHPIDSTHNPTNRSIDTAGKRFAKDVFKNLGTEMYFDIKNYMVRGQIRGITNELARELCSREHKKSGQKIVLQSKSEYKEAMGLKSGPKGSPDRADCFALLLQKAIEQGLQLGAKQLTDSLLQLHARNNLDPLNVELEYVRSLPTMEDVYGIVPLQDTSENVIELSSGLVGDAVDEMIQSDLVEASSVMEW